MLLSAHHTSAVVPLAAVTTPRYLALAPVLGAIGVITYLVPAFAWFGVAIAFGATSLANGLTWTGFVTRPGDSAGSGGRTPR